MKRMKRWSPDQPNDHLYSDEVICITVDGCETYPFLGTGECLDVLHVQSISTRTINRSQNSTAINVSWYYEALSEGRDSTPTPVQLSKYIQGINTYAKSGAWSILNDLLRDVDFSNSSTATVVAFCRATFPFRTHPNMQAWQKMMSRAKSELKLREKDIDRLLRGLG